MNGCDLSWCGDTMGVDGWWLDSYTIHTKDHTSHGFMQKLILGLHTKLCGG